jgi:hypothetical protein
MPVDQCRDDDTTTPIMKQPERLILNVLQGKTAKLRCSISRSSP